MSDFKIVTVCNRFPQEPYYCLNEFIKSLGEHEPLVLGTKVGEYTGLCSKPRLLYNAIKDGLIKERIILFTDCWDVVFQGDPIRSYDTFRNFPYNSDLVISAERNCFPTDLKEEYDNLGLKSKFRYVNSGFIITFTEAMLACLEYMDLGNVQDDYKKENGSNYHCNDQYLWQQIFLHQPVKMAMDTSTIFSTPLHSLNMSDLDFSEEYIRNDITGCASYHLHFNGNSKTENGLREPILKHLNLL